jgi:hypothetical protein
MSFYFERKIINFLPINKRILFFCLIFGLFYTISLSAQPTRQDYLDYINRYKNVALQYENEYGVPASITLAQGLLESYVGMSKMAQEANNHFGIKAYHWSGEVYSGYRKYGSPEDSYLDHAMVLKGSRYSVLHQLDVTDYRSWAQGLRDCGYAEDVNYPSKLIAIIEKYELYALNGGHLQNGDRSIQQDVEEQPVSDRWHHRKRRTRTSTEQNQVQQEQVQEQQQPFTPMRQGRVGSSADNE